MRNALTIAGKELRSYVASPLAYVVALLLLGVSGYVFTILILASPRAQTEHLGGVIGFMVSMMLLLVPLLTMGLLSQEKSSGTIELLMTRPVRDWEIVMGKYLGALGLVLPIFIITLQFPLIIELGGDLDWGMVLANYIGLVLAVMAFLAVGLFASSLTSNQIVAAVLGFSFLVLFWFIGIASYAVTARLGDVFKHLSILENLLDFSKGIIDTKSIVYFVTLIAYALFATVRSLENRRAT